MPWPLPLTCGPLPLRSASVACSRGIDADPVPQAVSATHTTREVSLSISQIAQILGQYNILTTPQAFDHASSGNLGSTLGASENKRCHTEAAFARSTFSLSNSYELSSTKFLSSSMLPQSHISHSFHSPLAHHPHSKCFPNIFAVRLQRCSRLQVGPLPFKPRQASNFVGCLVSAFPNADLRNQFYLSNSNPTDSRFAKEAGLSSTGRTRLLRDMYTTANVARSEWFIIPTDLDITTAGIN